MYIRFVYPCREANMIFVQKQLNFGCNDKSQHFQHIWGYQRNRITSIKKKVMRIITLNTYNSHTEPLFKNLKLLKIEDMLKLQELKFYFKYIHKQLPSYLLNWQIIPSINIHNYNTCLLNNYSDICTLSHCYICQLN